MVSTASKIAADTTFLALPRNGDLPELWLASTEEEAARPGYKSVRKCIEGNRSAGLSASSLLASVYLASLRWKRLLLVRHPEQAGLLRICNGLHNVCLSALRLSMRLSHIMRPAHTAGEC